MCTSLHEVFKVVSRNVCFVIVFSYILGRKYDFLKVVKIPYPKYQFLITLRSFFSSYKFFPGRGWFIPISISKEEYFNEKMSSLVDLKKKLFIFPQKYCFWPFLTTWVHLQSRLYVQAKFQKSLVSLLGEVVRNIVLKFGLSISSGLRGGGGG